MYIRNYDGNVRFVQIFRENEIVYLDTHLFIIRQQKNQLWTSKVNYYRTERDLQGSRRQRQ